MKGVSNDETFSLTWKLEYIHLSPQKTGEYISTPVFQVGILQNARLRLQLAPEGIDDPSHMGCSLHRMGSEGERHEPKIVKFQWKLCIIAEGGAVRFEKCVQVILERNECEYLPQFIPKSELLESDMPHSNLTIYCELTKDSDFSLLQESKYDFEGLSSDLGGLLESGFRSDFTMYCRGEIYKVHKFIILSRWPGFCERMEIDNISTRHDIIMTGVEAVTLKAFLGFLYTGKLQRKDISIGLCAYMHEQHCDDLMNSLVTPESNVEFVTHMHYEWKIITWEVGDDSAWETCKTPFFRVIPLEEVYADELVITFSFEKRDGEEWLKLVAEFTGLDDTQPLQVSGEINYTNKGAEVRTRQFSYLVEGGGEEWCLPRFVKKRELLPNQRNSKFIEINMCICDGYIPTRQVLSNVNNASSFKEVKDLRKLVMDLTYSSYQRDLKLIAGGKVYLVHSLMAAARSEKLRELIQESAGKIRMQEFMTKNVSESFIRHLYGQTVLDLEIGDAILLQNVANKYSLTTLEKKMQKILEG